MHFKKSLPRDLMYELRSFGAQDMQVYINVTVKIEKEMVVVIKLKYQSLEPISKRKPWKIYSSKSSEDKDSSNKLYKKMVEIFLKINNKISKLERDFDGCNRRNSKISTNNLGPRNAFRKFTNGLWNTNTKFEENQD